MKKNDLSAWARGTLMRVAGTMRAGLSPALKSFFDCQTARRLLISRRIVFVLVAAHIGDEATGT
jgi:hypothetical protein